MRGLGKIIFLTIAFALFVVLFWVADRNLFKLQHISISEVNQGTKEWLFQDIKKNLTSQTQALLGRYVWEVNLDDVLKIAESDKRIQSVQVKRSLPNKIDLQVRPHEPLAIYWGSRGEIYPVAADGTLLPRVSSTGYFNAPVLRGQIFFEEHDVRKGAMEILTAAEGLAAINRRNISEITFEKGHGYSLILSPEGEILKLGISDFEKRLAMGEKVVNYLNGQGLKGRVIDIRFSKKVVVRLRNAP